jgi:hypothetical protein
LALEQGVRFVEGDGAATVTVFCQASESNVSADDLLLPVLFCSNASGLLGHTCHLDGLKVDAERDRPHVEALLDDISGICDDPAVWYRLFRGLAFLPTWDSYTQIRATTTILNARIRIHLDRSAEACLNIANSDEEAGSPLCAAATCGYPRSAIVRASEIELLRATPATADGELWMARHTVWRHLTGTLREG